MSLLDDVIIVVTPNGYKAGELYAVIPVPTEGAEEITNGNFATDSDWTKVNSTISSGKATVTVVGGANSYITQTLSYTSGQKYKLTATINGTSGKEIKFQDRGNNSGGLTTTNGTVTLDGSDQNIEIYWIANSNSDGIVIARSTTSGDYSFTIDNVSVKEYTSADMDVTRATAATRVDENGLVNYAEVLGSENIDLTTGSTTKPSNWGSITTNGISYLAQIGTVEYYDTGFTVTSGITYKLTFTLSNYTGSNNLGFSGSGGVSSYARLDADGSYSEYFIASSSVELRMFGRNTATGVFTNVSVKEVTRDNVPRIDYTGGGCPHILAEPQRTNLVTYSEDFSQWSPINSTILSDNTTSPDGTVNADRITATSTGDSAFVRNTQSTQTVSTIYSYSCFVKKGTTDFVRLANRSLGNVSEASCWFDIQNGVVGDVGSNVSSTEIESFGDGWYKCTVIGTTGGTISTQLTDIAAATSNGNTSATTGDYIYYWGADLQQGSYATSYIPTSGSTVTRNQDIFTRDGIGSLINSTEGVLFVEMAALSNDGTNRQISISDGTSSQRIYFGFRTTDNEIIMSSNNVASGSYNSVTHVLNNATLNNKFAFKYKENNFALWVNGVEVGTDLIGVVPIGLNKLSFDNGSGSSPFYGKVKQLQVYNTALTDPELAALTS